MNKDEPQSTVTHQDHASLLDTVGYETKDGRQSLRDTGGSLGVSHVGDKHKITTYNTTDDTHRNVLNGKGREIVFATDEDARDFIAEEARRVKQTVIVNDNSPASVGDLERAAKSSARRREERESGSHKKSGPLLG